MSEDNSWVLRTMGSIAAKEQAKVAEYIRRQKDCPKCGRTFVLEHSPVSGKEQKTWQGGCGTPDRCFDLYMPASDFKPRPDLRKMHG